DTQARWVRNGAKRMPGDKMTSNGFARPGETRTRPGRGMFHRQGLHGYLRTGPGAPALDPMVERANTLADGRFREIRVVDVP
ncbi:MAG: hypothetical protein GDA36_05140, partial [Rhodobacteraceae bacterium]|nr:hypothetical protein [Paracoccaceae bacterium]